MNLKIIATISFALALSACEKKNEASEGVDDQGNCKIDFINSYNTVVDDTTVLKKAWDLPEGDLKNTQTALALTKLNTSCKVMIAKYKGTVCNAKLAANANPVPVTYESLRPNCDTIQKSLASKPTEKPFSGHEIEKPIEPAADLVFLTED